MPAPRGLCTLPYLALSQLAVTGAAQAALLEPGFSETVLLAPSGQAGTTAIAWAPDGSNRLFYTRQTGSLRVVEAGVLKQLASVAPLFTGGDECGVLSLAFDPRFAENGFVYLFVTVSNSEQQIIRYRLDGNVVQDKSAIVTGLPTRGLNHNAGGLGFGPDGKLYFTIGDLGNGTGIGNDLTSLAAKVSRVNLDGSAPEDNPFFDGDGPHEDRIWARGFRNPFTFTWQPATDRLWVSVAGSKFEQLFLPEAGDNAGWISYENNQPEGFLAPTIAYPTSGGAASLITATGATRTSGVATFSTALSHGLRVGGFVTIAGVTDATFNGPGFVSDVPSPETFSLAQGGPDATSGSGSATPLDLGNAITGGTFWDSSSVPAEYRGNYFFGDYGSGNIARVVLGPDNQVSSFALWATTGARMIDLAVGPDGDLYYATFEGGFYRVHYNASTQGIVASDLHPRVTEAGQAVFSVRLAMQPTEPVTVSLERTAGDVDVDTEQGELIFDASNWSVPQPVHVAAQADDDAANDRTELTLSSAGLPDEVVEVRVTDDDQVAILAVPSEVTLTEGSSTDLSVVLNGAPATPVEVMLTTNEASAIGLEPEVLTFEPHDWAEPQTVTLSAYSAVEAETFTLAGRSLLSAEVSVTVLAAVPGAAGEAGAPSTSTGGGGAEPQSGASGEPAGGQAAGGAPDGMMEASPSDGSGCSCRLPRDTTDSSPLGLLVTALALWLRRRAPSPSFRTPIQKTCDSPKPT